MKEVHALKESCRGHTYLSCMAYAQYTYYAIRLTPRRRLARRVLDAHGMAAMRARQHTRVFRQLGFDARSEEMWRVIDAMEKRCTHNSELIYVHKIAHVRGESSSPTVSLQ